MKKRWLVVVSLVLVFVALVLLKLTRNSRDAIADRQPQAVAYQRVLDLVSDSSATFNGLLDEIDRQWHPGTAVMVLEVVRFSRSPRVLGKTITLLEQKTEQNFGRDHDAWYQWLWNQKYNPHPEYAKFKSDLYLKIDTRFGEYFEETDNARIRLDEILWGGVVRDGIPPLKNPKMISAQDATYLDDSNVVFGVNLNGDARCYPKRILAWHEMFKDTIGNVSVCGAY